MRRVGALTAIAVLALALSGAGSAARAQDVLVARYSLGFPAGDSRDFTEEIGFLGGDLGFRRFTSRSVSWGVSIGFQSFDENTVEALPVSEGTIAGRQFRYLNVFPAYLGLQLHLGRGDFRPYLAANAGAHLVLRRTQFGIGRWEKTGVHAAIAPEAGVLFPVGHYGGIVSVRYHLTTSNEDFRPSHLSVSLGVVNDF